MHKYVDTPNVATCGQPAGNSTASTVPGDPGAVGKGQLTTPKPKMKRSTSSVSKSKTTPPGKRRDILKKKQSTRSPTVAYSPQKGAGGITPARKRTAMKAKAKKPKTAKGKEGGESSPVPKTEPTGEDTAKAVQEALTRKATHELPETPSSAPKSSQVDTTAKTAKKLAAAAPGAPDDDDEDQELSLVHFRAKKAAHARYMRFSRSMKAKGALSPI